MKKVKLTSRTSAGFVVESSKNSVSDSQLQVQSLLNTINDTKTNITEITDDNVTIDNDNRITFTSTFSNDTYFYTGENFNPPFVMNPGTNNATFLDVSVRKSTGDVYVSGVLTTINNINFNNDPDMPKSNNKPDGCKVAKYNPNTDTWTPIFFPRDLFLNVSDSASHNRCRSVLNNTTNILYLLVDFKRFTNDAGWVMLVRYNLTTSTFSYVSANFPIYDYSHSTSTYNASMATYGGNIKTFQDGTPLGDILCDRGNGVLECKMHVDETTNKLYIVVPAFRYPNHQRQVITIDENAGGYATASSVLSGVNTFRGSKKVDNNLYIYGSGGNDLYIYNIITDSWSGTFNIPSGHGVNDIAFVNENSFYVATYSGGPRYFVHYKKGPRIEGSADFLNGYTSNANNGYIYKVLNNLPTSDDPLTVIYVTGLLYLNDSIYMCSNNSTKIHKYDITNNTFTVYKRGDYNADGMFSIGNTLYVINGSLIFGYGVIGDVNASYKLTIKYHPSSGSDITLANYDTPFNVKNYLYHINVIKVGNTVYSIGSEKLAITKLS